MQRAPGVVETIFRRKQQIIDIGIHVDTKRIQADITATILLAIVEFGIGRVESQRTAYFDGLGLFVLVDFINDVLDGFAAARSAGACLELDAGDGAHILVFVIACIGDLRVLGVVGVCGFFAVASLAGRGIAGSRIGRIALGELGLFARIRLIRRQARFERTDALAQRLEFIELRFERLQLGAHIVLALSVCGINRQRHSAQNHPPQNGFLHLNFPLFAPRAQPLSGNGSRNHVEYNLLATDPPHVRGRRIVAA